MARFRKVDPRIWNDEKFQTLAPLDKLVALYCLTGQCNRIGIFKFSIAMAGEDLGIKSTDVRERLDRVCDTLSWHYDDSRRVLYLPLWWRYNSPGSPKTLAGILEDAHEVPKCKLLNLFASNSDSLSDTLSHTLSAFFGKGMPYQEQEQEQEQEQDTPLYPPKGIGEAFAEFWKAFPSRRRQKKPQALDKFTQAVKSGRDTTWLIQRAKDYAASDEGVSEYVRGPVPWLNQLGYDDEPEAWNRSEGKQQAATKEDLAQWTP